MKKQLFEPRTNLPYDGHPSAHTLRESAAQLHRSSDQLNQQLIEAERYFATLGLGVAGQVPIESSGKLTRYLRFSRHDGRWRLSLHLHDRRNDSWSDHQHVCTAPRHVRCLAAHSLPALQVALLEAVEAARGEVDTAVGLTWAFLPTR